MGNSESRIHKWMGDGTDQDYREEVPIIASLNDLQKLVKTDDYTSLLNGDYSEFEEYPHIMKLLISYNEHTHRQLNSGPTPQKYLFKKLKDSIWWLLNQEGMTTFCTQGEKPDYFPHFKKASDFWNEWENSHEFTINSIDHSPWKCVPQCLKMIKRYESIIHNNYICDQSDKETRKEKILKNCDKFIAKQVKSDGAVGECAVCQEFYVCCGFSSCPHTLCAACTKKIITQDTKPREKVSKSSCPICRREIRGVFFFLLSV